MGGEVRGQLRVRSGLFLPSRVRKGGTNSSMALREAHRDQRAWSCAHRPSRDLLPPYDSRGWCNGGPSLPTRKMGGSLSMRRCREWLRRLKASTEPRAQRCLCWLGAASARAERLLADKYRLWTVAYPSLLGIPMSQAAYLAILDAYRCPG